MTPKLCTCLLLFCFCCSARTLYGQNSSFAPWMAPDSISAADDSLNSTDDMQLLKEVVIKKRFAVKVNKDTTFITADSIIARKFDNLEELMRRIPGIQVSKDGDILYYGQPIRQIGIDGQAFSGLDPRRLLQLLRGRDVDLLKIYNLETSAGNPERFADRQEKGLDIRLKEEVKRGYYGKLSAGFGKRAQAQWDQSADISSFTGERKVSAYIQSGNTGGQSAFPASEPPAQDLSSLPRGKPGNGTAGIFYDRKINGRLSVNGNYSLSRATQDIVQQTTERSFLPSGNIRSAARANSGTGTLSNSANIQAVYTIDSLSFISLAANAGLNKSDGAYKNYAATDNEDTALLSSSILTGANKVQSSNALMTLSYNKRFRHAGSLVCSFAPNWSNSKSRAEQYSYLDLAASGTVQEFTQQKYNTESSKGYAMSTDYKYPLSRTIGLGLNWQGSWTQSESVQETYDRYRRPDGQLLDTLNPLYSNGYRLKKISNILGAAIAFTGKKYTLRLGSYVQNITWDQQAAGLSNGVSNFTNLLPSASLRMALSRKSVLHLGYQVQSTQPLVSQVQPLVNNTDPMNIIVGNPGLSQSFTHSTSAGYTFAGADGRRSLHLGGSLSLVRKAISFGQYVDENGRRTSRYYNQDGNHNGNFSLSYDQWLGKHVRMSVQQSAGFSNTNILVNNEENAASAQSYASRFSLAYHKDTALSLRLETTASYILSLARTSPGIMQRSKMNNYGAVLNINYSLPFGGVVLGTSFSWNLNKNNIGNGSDFLVWNTSIQKNMNKSQSLLVKLYIYDLLNRNKGYFAYNELNVQREERFNSIERFFLLGLTWHFTKR